MHIFFLVMLFPFVSFQTMQFCKVLFIFFFCYEAIAAVSKKEFSDWKSPNGSHEPPVHSWDFEFDDKQVQVSQRNTIMLQTLLA